MKIKHEILRRPVPILVAKVWRQNLDYVKNLQDLVKFLPAKTYDTCKHPGALTCIICAYIHVHVRRSK